MALSTLGLGAAVGSPYQPAGVAMGAGLAVMATAGAAHQDSRHRRGIGGQLPAKIDMETSLVPFVALITGGQSWQPLVQEVKWMNAILGISAAVVLALARHRAISRVFAATT